VNAFIVDLKNKPSELAKVAEAIAQKGIDITGFSGSTCGDSGTLALVTDNEPVTQGVLTDGGWTFRTIELVETELANRPGVLAETARMLAAAGIHIEAAFPDEHDREQRPHRLRDGQPGKGQAVASPGGRRQPLDPIVGQVPS
jgi:hypothetical protein